MKTEIALSQNKINDPDDLEIKITLSNESDHELKLWLLTMDYSSLYIEVCDSAGNILGNLPASVPPLNDTKFSLLKPGNSLTYTTQGLPVSRGFLKKGNYKVRCNTELPSGEKGEEQIKIQSDWAKVEITGSDL